MKNPIVKSDQACKVCVLESIYPTIHLVSCKTKISVCHFFKILRVPCDVMWCICNIRLSWIIFIFWLLFSGYILITFRLVVMSVFNQYSLFFQFFFSCFVWSISFRSIFDKWSPSLMTRMTPMMMMTMTITWIKYQTEKNEKEKNCFFLPFFHNNNIHVFLACNIFFKEKVLSSLSFFSITKMIGQNNDK